MLTLDGTINYQDREYVVDHNDKVKTHHAPGLKLVGLTPGRTSEEWAPEPTPDLRLYLLLYGGGPVGIHETDVGRINLDDFHATTVGSLFSNGYDQVGDVIGEWQGNASDTVDTETWVRATWNNRRKGERAGELKFMSEDAI